jgi:hypothetical protein
MVVRTVLNGFTIELEVELNIDQEPQDNKQWSLESTDLENRDYEIANNGIDLDVINDSDPTNTLTVTTTYFSYKNGHNR